MLQTYNKHHKLKVKKRSSIILSEANKIIFDPKFTKIDDDEYHSDIFDAILYAFKWVIMEHKKTEKEKLIITDPVMLKLEEIRKKEREEKEEITKRDYFSEFDDFL